MGHLSNLFSEFDIRASRVSTYLFAEPQSFKDWGSQAMFMESALSSKWFTTGKKVTSRVLYHVFGNTLDSMTVRNLLQDASVLSLIFRGVTPSNLTRNPVATLVADRPERVCLGYVDYALNLHEHLVDAYDNYCRLEYRPEEPSLDGFWKIISANPYKLSLLDCRFTLEELDSLALFFGFSLLSLPEDVSNMRYAMIVHIRMLETNGLSAQSSLVPYSVFIGSAFPVFAIENSTFERIQKDSLWFSDETCALISGLFDVSRDKFSVDYLFSLPWVSTKVGMRVFDVSSNSGLLQVYRASSLGYVGSTVDCSVPAFVGDLFNLYRESWLARWFECSLGDFTPGYTHLSEIQLEGFLKDFETRAGFVLEDAQKAVLGMLKHRAFVVSGVAGSGKTTVASLLYRYLRKCGLDQTEIAFCAPTGRAAARIREVVGTPAFTLHSYFRLASDGTSTLPLVPAHSPRPKVIIVDECSMINLSVFYEFVHSLPETTQVILIGDMHQLPPIGVGRFFADIQSWIPSVYLSVSKRASDASGLVRNSSRILEFGENTSSVVSTSMVIHDEDDVRVSALGVDDLYVRLFSLVRNHVSLKHSLEPSPEMVLSGQLSLGAEAVLPCDLVVPPNEFQVVTPFRKYAYGADALNCMLQDLFNPVTGLESIRMSTGSVTQSVVARFKDGSSRVIRLGDRVIHTANQAKLARYSRHGMSFSKLPVFGGIMNGDVGYVTGIYRFKNMRFSGVKPLSIDSESLVLVVDYNDVDSTGTPYTFSILYPLTVAGSVYRSSSSDSRAAMLGSLITEVEVNYGGLMNLELAYALTVHKMQGSQAKLVVFVLFPSAAGSDFISRNLLYTGVTRASSGLYVLGDVSDGSYVVPLALKTDALSTRYTLLRALQGLR